MATITLTDSDIRAFPGAEGYGRNSLSGRGQSVYFVTNTNDSGAGSFRQALSDAGTSGGIIIFRVGGTINVTGNPYTLGDHITPNAGGDSYGNLYIAGQTAPGDGITFRCDDVNYGAGFYIKGSDITMRHVRVHAGDAQVATQNIDCIRIFQEEGDAGQGHLIEDVIVDHCSLKWSTDEIIEIGAYGGGTTRNISITNCLLAESLGENYGILLFTSNNSGGTMSDVSIWGNMFNNINDRSPYGSSCGINYEVINNIRYNCRESNNVTYGNDVDFDGNIFKNNNTVQPDSSTFTFRYIENTFECPGQDPATGSVYENDTLIINDNTGNTLKNTAWLNNDSLTRVNTNSLITPRASSEVEGLLLNSVGASINRDAHDTILVNDYINSTGALVSSESYGTYNSGTPYTDTNGNGLSDTYEAANGGSPSPSDRPATFTIANGDTVDQSGVTNFATQGYTHMDVFLADLAGDWDSFTSSGGGGGISVTGNTSSLYLFNP